MSEAGRTGVVVIGGGISGLSALWHLHRAGIDAELFDASPRPGGVIRTHRRDGFVIEGGPGTVLGSPELRTLVDELELGSELVEAKKGLPRYLYARGRLHPAPLGPIALATSSLLSLRTKLELLGEPWNRSRAADADESVRDFFVRRFGAEIADRLVAPMISGTFAGDAAKLSLRSVFPTLASLEARHGSVVRGFLRERRAGNGPAARGSILSFRTGLAALPERLAVRLADRIRSGAVVEAVRHADGEFEVQVRGGGPVHARSIVLATPAPEASAILAGILPEASTALAAIGHPPLACVSVACGRADVRHDLRGFGFLVPRGEDLRILGCIWASSVFPRRAPDDRVSFTCFVGGATAPDLAGLDDAELAALVAEDLRHALGAQRPPAVLAIDRYERAIPQYTIGHESRVASIRGAIAAVPGLSLAGNYLSGVSVGDCVRSGREAAEEAERSLRAKTPGVGPGQAVDFSPSRG